MNDKLVTLHYSFLDDTGKLSQEAIEKFNLASCCKKDIFIVCHNIDGHTYNSIVQKLKSIDCTTNCLGKLSQSYCSSDCNMSTVMASGFNYIIQDGYLKFWAIVRCQETVNIAQQQVNFKS